jgi:hypothetical protein
MEIHQSSDDYNLNIIKKYIDKINSQKNKKKNNFKATHDQSYIPSKTNNIVTY